MTSQPDMSDLDGGTAFEHALLARAFHLLLADPRPLSPARLAAALASEPERVERTLARAGPAGPPPPSGPGRRGDRQPRIVGHADPA